MTWSSSLGDPKAVFVADTSVLININATGCASKILNAFPCKFVVANNVFLELENGRQKGHLDADAFEELSVAGCLDRVALCEKGAEIYETLIAGLTHQTLDDGEAATIGCAVGSGAIPLIDERKALRLCAERFPNLQVACTIDVLLSPHVLKVLGERHRAEAIFLALRDARMRIPRNRVDYVKGMIGNERANECSSLPKSSTK